VAVGTDIAIVGTGWWLLVVLLSNLLDLALAGVDLGLERVDARTGLPQLRLRDATRLKQPEGHFSSLEEGLVAIALE
jgi:hypothetical protein